jgi:2-phosphosulfolactate phosphatase
MIRKPATLCVHFLPEMVSSDELADSTVVAVDVLRATSTIVHALGNGASAVRICLEIDEARRLAAKLKASPGLDVLLGGERGGKPIEGFDLGNSPEEYTPAQVTGKTVVMTTTNGTRAIRHAARASRILVGAFSNLSATCNELIRLEQIDIVCAGTENQITREDVLFAGAVAHEVTLAQAVQLNDQAELAIDAWRKLQHDIAGGVPLAEILRSSLGARNLIEIGMESDIEIAARIDAFDLVAEVDKDLWEVRRAAK